MHPDFTPSDIKRFWEKVETSSDFSTCWEWQACTIPSGYGQFWVHRKAISSHRVAWMLVKGSIPDGMVVCHACDNPRCCNPSHLFLGTNRDNTQDMIRKGRMVIAHHGSESPQAKLNDMAVKRLRKLAKNAPYGFYAREARRYGVDPATIRDAVFGRTWRHVK